MDVRKAVLKMIGTVNGSWTVAAAYLGMTENSLRNRAYETKGQALSTHDQLTLQELSGTTLFAEAIAVASGGTFVKLPGVDEIENDSIQAMFNQHYAELGVLFSTFTAAIGDDEIDEDERAKLEAQGELLHRKTETLLALMFSVYCRHSKALKLEPVREVANG
ncbi:hypothetical protein ASD15_22005 [Massilia sp. Root351]|uniref:YmfL family putative regulatory protein n=1 Tax=Massilia sp. Root351 TaxID=1736522 RepID=UPI0007094590|nr:YmfL family putative regulatory protein [Massilia sp. Root351]KQV78489.1 hypothetical protein ASD15_22005 [Massilia sp. Root351]